MVKVKGELLLFPMKGRLCVSVHTPFFSFSFFSCASVCVSRCSCAEYGATLTRTSALTTGGRTRPRSSWLRSKPPFPFVSSSSFPFVFVFRRLPQYQIPRPAPVRQDDYLWLRHNFNFKRRSLHSAACKHPL